MSLTPTNTTALAATIFAALAAQPLAHGTALAQGATGAVDGERCYGIALAGKNDGLASGAAEFVPGTSQDDYQGDAWVLVPKGECETTATPRGTASLTPSGG